MYSRHCRCPVCLPGRHPLFSVHVCAAGLHHVALREVHHGYARQLCFVNSNNAAHAGNLDLPWSYDVSQLALAALFLATTFTGIRFWSQPVDALDGQRFNWGGLLIWHPFLMSHQCAYGRQVLHLLECRVCLGDLVHTMAAFVTTFLFRQRSSYKVFVFRAKEETHRLTLVEVGYLHVMLKHHFTFIMQTISPLYSVFWIGGFVYAWAHASGPDFLAKNIYVIFFWTGVMFSHCAVCSHLYSITSQSYSEPSLTCCCFAN